MWPLSFSSPHSPSHPADARLILLVDNDDGLRDITETMLTEAGYRVVSAPDGIAAFGAFERHPDIALLFTDVMMPKIDGLMLADMVKLRRPALKVLYATAFAEDVRRQPGYRYGEVLDKPYRSAELVAAVERALEAPSTRQRPAA
jgi:CheY-like chemotaxis protein